MARSQQRSESKPVSQGQRGGRAPVNGHRPRLVSPANFILATRDSGYRSTGMAIAEFVDNAIQAGARRVDVGLATTSDHAFPIEIRVVDDGAGMDEITLSSALTFGGSSRFDDRTSLGRYGMGLPNGALSRARCVEVTTWQNGRVFSASLDVDDFVARGRRALRPARVIERPSSVPATRSGTAVVLRRCDRLELRRPSALARRVISELARVYRRFLVDGLDLRVNGEVVRPYDPLMLMSDAIAKGGRQFGDVLRYCVEGTGGTGLIEVRFSELPIEQWHMLPAERKRELGVTSSPCVSILRAHREIDSGWFFTGSKRRENYDDWWRCEVAFEPSLDELFGLTHAKQSIAPRPELLELLVPDVEPIARGLNSRVRRRFELTKVKTPLTLAEKQASRAASSLPPLRVRSTPIPSELRDAVGLGGDASSSTLSHRIVVTDLPGSDAFDVVLDRGTVIVVVNSQHPLYRDVVGPLAGSDTETDRVMATRIVLGVLAAGHVEGSLTRKSDRQTAADLRHAWGQVLATFLNS